MCAVESGIKLICSSGSSVAGVAAVATAAVVAVAAVAAERTAVMAAVMAANKDCRKSSRCNHDWADRNGGIAQ